MELLPEYISGIVVVILFTAFVKISTSLTILRYGLGLHGIGFGVVVLGASFALSLLVMESSVLTSEQSQELMILQAPTDASVLEQRFRPFLTKHTDPQLMERFSRLATELRDDAEMGDRVNSEESFSLLAASFLFSELREAFTLGLLFIIPFLVIDLIVANVLMLLGVTQISSALVALPVKLVMFVVLDGWALIVERLILSYSA